MVARIAGILAGSTPGEIVHNVTASANNIDARTLFGSPSAAGNYHLKIDGTATPGGIIIGSDGVTTNCALHTGTGWNAGATLKISIKNAKVLGIGGNGNTAGAGGDAIRLGKNVSIDNSTGGLIGGGGGGGTTGQQGVGPGGLSGAWGGGGGGGGGGQGYLGGAAGAGAAAQSSPPASDGSPGTAGSATAPGAGGAGGAGSLGAPSGSDGGPGGTLGSAAPYGGGAPGKAIALAGFSVIWIAGNNSAQVKGAVA